MGVVSESVNGSHTSPATPAKSPISLSGLAQALVASIRTELNDGLPMYSTAGAAGQPNPGATIAPQPQLQAFAMLQTLGGIRPEIDNAQDSDGGKVSDESDSGSETNAKPFKPTITPHQFHMLQQRYEGSEHASKLFSIVG